MCSWSHTKSSYSILVPTEWPGAVARPGEDFRSSDMRHAVKCRATQLAPAIRVTRSSLRGESAAGGLTGLEFGGYQRKLGGRTG